MDVSFPADEVTIRKFAEEVIGLVGNPQARLAYRELPTDDPKQRRPDINLAKEVLDWEPKTTRQEGMHKVLPYFLEKVGRK